MLLLYNIQKVFEDQLAKIITPHKQWAMVALD